MNEYELRKLFPRASKSLIRRNADPVVGGVVPALDKPKPGRALVKDVQARQEGQGGVRYCITLISCRRKPIDGHDNLKHGQKSLVDAIAEWIGHDDADPRISWQYSQIKTDGPEGVIVTIQQDYD